MITSGGGINILLDSTRAFLAPLGYVCRYEACRTIIWKII